jgi:hypothetical protein
MNISKINWQQAATEFVVIVVGVLAALAVNQWNENRNDRATEAEYLIRLRADLSEDIREFTTFEQVFETKGRIIKDLRDQSVSTLVSRDPEGLLQDLVFSSYYGLPASRSTTFDELSSTGRLMLIQDVALRDALTRYHTRHELLSEILFVGNHGDYLRLLQESLPGELFYQWRLLNKLDDPEVLRRGLEVLISDPGLAAAANAEITYAAALIYYIREYRQHAEELLERLDE